MAHQSFIKTVHVYFPQLFPNVIINEILEYMFFCYRNVLVVKGSHEIHYFKIYRMLNYKTFRFSSNIEEYLSFIVFFDGSYERDMNVNSKSRTMLTKIKVKNNRLMIPQLDYGWRLFKINK